MGDDWRSHGDEVRAISNDLLDSSDLSCSVDKNEFLHPIGYIQRVGSQKLRQH